MSDTLDPIGALGALKSFFFANDKSLPASTRQKIAMALMTQKRKYPTTLGEGLGAIGDSLGDIGMMRRLERDAAETEARGKALDPTILGGGAVPAAAKPLAYGSSDDIVPQDAPAVAPPLARSIAPPPLPAPGNLPPTGEPGNTGATTFPPVPPSVPGGAPATAVPPPPRQAIPPTLPAPAPPMLAPNFNQRFDSAFPGRQSDAGPMSGAPVMAFGGEPSENVPPPAGPRDIVAATLTNQAARGPQPNPTPAPMLPGGNGPSANAFQQVAQAPPDPAAAIKKAPQYEPDYVPPARPEAQPPPLTTPLIQRIQEAYRAAAPADREMIAERYKDVIATESAKVNQAHEMWKAQVVDDRAYEAKRQELLSTKAKRGQEYRKTASEMPGGDVGVGAAPPGAVPPGAAILAGPNPLLGTDQSPQRSGIPKVEPAPPTAIPKEWAKDQQEKISATQDAISTAAPQLKEALDLMNQIRTHAGKSRSIGLLGGIGRATSVGQGFVALDEQLKGKNLVEAYKIIKGTGPVGQKEGENVAKSQTALTTAGTEKDYDKALDTLETTIRGTVERLERKLNRPVTAYQRTPDDPPAPDIGQIATWKGRLVEYVGGDPSKDSSYKTVRR